MTFSSALLTIFFVMPIIQFFNFSILFQIFAHLSHQEVFSSITFTSLFANLDRISFLLKPPQPSNIQLFKNSTSSFSLLKHTSPTSLSHWKTTVSLLNSKNFLCLNINYISCLGNRISPVLGMLSQRSCDFL